MSTHRSTTARPAASAGPNWARRREHGEIAFGEYDGQQNADHRDLEQDGAQTACRASDEVAILTLSASKAPMLASRPGTRRPA